MPIYEYHCQTCNSDFEEMTGQGDGDKVKCPDCGTKANRQLSLFSFKFHNPFTKDGEGYSSVTYPPDEYGERVKNNMAKGD